MDALRGQATRFEIGPQIRHKPHRPAEQHVPLPIREMGQHILGGDSACRVKGYTGFLRFGRTVMHAAGHATAFRGQAVDLRPKGVGASVSGSVDEGHRPLPVRGCHSMQHRQHRRDPHPRAD